MSALPAQALAMARADPAPWLWPAAWAGYVATAVTDFGHAGFMGEVVLAIAAVALFLGSLRSLTAVHLVPVVAGALLVGWVALARALAVGGPPLAAGSAGFDLVLVAGLVLLHAHRDPRRLIRDLATGAAACLVASALACPLLLVVRDVPLTSALIFGFDNLNPVALLLTPLLLVALASDDEDDPAGPLRHWLLLAATLWLVVIGLATIRRGQLLFLALAVVVVVADRSGRCPPALRRWGILAVGATAALVLAVVVALPAGGAVEAVAALDPARVHGHRAAVPEGLRDWFLGRGPAPALQIDGDDRDLRYLHEGGGPLGHVHATALQRLAAAGAPALLALLALLAWTGWRATDRRADGGTARCLAWLGAVVAVSVDDLTLRLEGALALGLLLGIAAGTPTPDRRVRNRWIPRAPVAAAAVAAAMIAVTGWHPARVHRADLAEHRSALAASTRPVHATWHAQALLEAGATAPDDVDLVRERLGDYRALRWYRPPEERQRWADLHPLDLSVPARPDPARGPRQATGARLRDVLAADPPVEDLAATLREALADWRGDPCLTWSLVRLRADHRAAVDAAVEDWSALPVSTLHWRGPDATLLAGMSDLPLAAVRAWRSRLDARRNRDPRTAPWLRWLDRLLSDRGDADRG